VANINNWFDRRNRVNGDGWLIMDMVIKKVVVCLFIILINNDHGEIAV
jgi:hypothetical protein